MENLKTKIYPTSGHSSGKDENSNLKRYMHMFKAALFTTAKTGKQPKCPWADEWIKEMWDTHIYNGILLSHRKEWNDANCSNMDGHGDDLTGWIKSDRQRQVFYDVTNVWNLKKSMNELIYKTKTDSQT